MEFSHSKVQLLLVDILDQPIKNLKVEIKTAERIWYVGATSDTGLIEFTATRGQDLVVCVEHWLFKQMKPVARFFSGLDEISIKLVSPKVKQTVALKPKATQGNYLRGTYKVKPGDTLSGIAKVYDVSVDYLAEINSIENNNVLSRDQILKVPPVKNRSTTPQKHTPAKPNPPHSALTVAAGPKTANGTTPLVEEKANLEGKAVTVLSGAQPSVIFPLKVRPLNDAGGSFANQWTKTARANAACFGSGRKKKGGGVRRHAARDLYAQDLTEVVAIAPGKVLRVAAFYCQTHAITIKHETSDGRKFVIRYGEVDPATICVKQGDPVTQGQLLGKTGILKNADGSKLIVTQGKNVSMVHFEAFSGANGLDSATDLSGSHGEYLRRADLIDPLTLLQEGYLNTFKSGAPSLSPVNIGNRIPVAQLNLSDKGENFIKAYEKKRLDYYEDHLGYCTVGWGHLTNGKTSCSSQGIAIGTKIAETEAQALFIEDKDIHVDLVRRSIRASLYQHEFDALCSLAFNIGSLSKKAPGLCRKINAGDYAGGATEFLDITNNGTAGLVIRRKQENAMFLTANYDSTH